MKVAFVFDDLIQFGGAERVLLGIHDLYPDAPIYTSVVSKRWKNILSEKNIQVHTSFLQHFPFIEKINRYYALFLLHIFAFERFDLSQYNLVISISARFAHAVITKPQTYHICYINSPGRMFWETESYFENESFGYLKMFKKFARIFMSPFLHLMRLWDFTSAQRVDLFISNCETIRDKVKRYYRRDSEVVYPYTDLEISDELDNSKADYFLVITRLLPWKKVDLAVEACSKLNLPLKVIGQGPDLQRLKNLSGNNVEFMGFVSEEEKTRLLSGCRALINTQKEDFGIVPLEAMSFGKPVIAYGVGGVTETVVKGETGEFFDEQTVESLENSLKDFDHIKYSPENCKKRAEKFSKTVFDSRIQEIVNRVYF